MLQCVNRHIVMRQRWGAFTLIEMLIVIAISGIVGTAMLGIVQNQAAAARRAATDDTVRKTRQAIALYREQTEQLPDLISGWEPIIKRTKVGNKWVGPFMNRPPRNAMVPGSGNASCIADGNVPILYLDECSFLYDYAGGGGTGRFVASYEVQKAKGGGKAAVAAVNAAD